MAISAQLVKDLRERTGSGMMECKKALVETDGDLDAAVELMRKRGLAKADKKADRVAAEGGIHVAVSGDRTSGAMVEINSETDFVANGDDFKAFADAVAQRVLAENPDDLDALHALPVEAGGDKDINTARQELVAKIGENIQVRRFIRYANSGGVIGSYLHGARIGVMVELEGGDEELARNICMHIAASRPMCVSPEDVPEETRKAEKDILVAQAQDSGKPENIIEKMVEGRMKKWLSEVALVGQPFVKDPDKTVGKLLEEAGAKVVAFRRFEVGEGIEKKKENFAEEVKAQVEGS